MDHLQGNEHLITMETAHASSPGPIRTRIIIHGAVQGVGFRPFVYRLAKGMGLTGWVSNTPQGVIIEAEGEREVVSSFVRSLPAEKPRIACIHSFEPVFLDAIGYATFDIRDSDLTGSRSAVVLPDIATCEDCRAELFDPNDRRYLYPFINCTNCGPRFTIIDALPYDRPTTSMAIFSQCPECLAEYHDPGNRRFHAQPNACPVCGPSVALWDRDGSVLALDRNALDETSRALADGRIVAVKGIGGFHLMCDAGRSDTVRELRQRKRREEKPFALMASTIEHCRQISILSPEEERLLSSAEAPIVLVRRRSGTNFLDEAVPSGNPYLGLMLPSTPLHHILLREGDLPLIATSGNMSDEPICIDELDVLRRLGGMADLFLVHNRPIRRHVDDSIVRVVRDREQVLRRARGYAPLPIMTKRALRPVIAVGAHLKNTVALSSDHRIVVSQHIGDLETVESMDAFCAVVKDLPRLHDITPESIACDLHPDYRSTQYAAEQSLPRISVQHHAAHVYACMAENELEPPVLGVSWDGTGLGSDGTIWGGEFLTMEDHAWKRSGWIRPFRLPGGDAAVKEPRRCGLSVLHEMYGGETDQYADMAPYDAFTDAERRPILQMLERSLNSPITTSAGRLFDAVASILGIRHLVRHEGQAAMNLEWLACESSVETEYPVTVDQGQGGVVLDWRPMIRQIVREIRSGLPTGDIARGFHTSLAEAICRMAQITGISKVVLTGGCFQNLLLTELTYDKLVEAGFRVYLHQRIPMNDGGISIGQVYAASVLHPYHALHSASQEMA